METRLSSRMTFVAKIIFPVLWGGVWMYGTWMLFNRPGSVRWNGSDGPAPSWAKWVFLAALVIGGFVCRAATLLKNVWLEGDHLLVVDYRRRISIPLGDVSVAGLDYRERYDEGVSFRPIFIGQRRPTCVLNLRIETRFGNTIRFIPRSRNAIAVLQEQLSRQVGQPLEEYSHDEARREESEEFFGRGTV